MSIIFFKNGSVIITTRRKEVNLITISTMKGSETLSRNFDKTHLWNSINDIKSLFY